MLSWLGIEELLINCTYDILYRKERLELLARWGVS
jgi:hypothetical protein